MLRETGLSVSEAAYRSGFRNPFHFSRLVKAETGQTPTVYRERVWRRAPERKE
jgi:AraC-like DNA-binding protein